MNESIIKWKIIPTKERLNEFNKMIYFGEFWILLVGLIIFIFGFFIAKDTLYAFIAAIMGVISSIIYFFSLRYTDISQTNEYILNDEGVSTFLNRRKVEYKWEELEYYRFDLSGMDVGVAQIYFNFLVYKNLVKNINSDTYIFIFPKLTGTVKTKFMEPRFVILQIPIEYLNNVKDFLAQKLPKK